MGRQFSRPRIAIIGAGISGLSLAQALVRRGLDVVVFEKSRGPGGRMSTRRSSGGRTFDHGAQFFTAHSPAFKEQVERWQADGLVAPWSGRFATITADGRTPDTSGRLRYVGVPRMSALTRHLSRGIYMVTGTRVASLERSEGGWTLTSTAATPYGPFSVVLSTAPAPQAVPLLAPHSAALARRAEGAMMLPCFCLMLTFDAPLTTPLDAAEVQVPPLSWLARNSSKPGRAGEECWVLHADASWSQARLQDDPASIHQAMLAAFRTLTDSPPPSWSSLHRWRYARAVSPAEPAPSFLWDPALGLGAAGDWLVGGRVESAWQSGTALSGAVLDWIQQAATLRT